MIRTGAFIIVCCSLFALAYAQPTAHTYENLNAVLWMQTSVEYRASATQTYHAAEAALLRGLRDTHWTAALEQTGSFEGLPPAVILDLDETVLDNSAFRARLLVSGDQYTDEAWVKWVREQNAGLVPGAIDFLQFAHANGVAAIYITNRVCEPSKVDDPTVKLLRTLQLPIEPITDSLLCAQNKNETDKTTRRLRSASKYRILLLFGDQLGDFLQIAPGFENLEGRDKLFAAHRRLWGERWFQLSNPMYGSWEAAVGSSVSERLSKLRK